MSSPQYRQQLKESAFQWVVDNLDSLVECFNVTLPAKGAHAEYHAMVDGIVWSDELPKVIDAEQSLVQTAFCILVHLRTSKILGERVSAPAEELQILLRSSAPRWSFMQPARWSTDRQGDYQDVRAKFFLRLDRTQCPESDREGGPS